LSETICSIRTKFQFWPFEEISIFSNGGQLGYRTALTDTILKGTHLGIPARFGLIWFSGFKGEDLNVIFYQNMPNLHNRYIARMCPNLNCISIMMSFLTYITGFYMNFELLPILTDYAN
jgi:hypothetical protein